MPQLDAALIAFAKLVGLLDSSGTVQWSWFANPLNNALLDIAANRALIGALMRALLDRPESNTNQKYDAANNLEWEPVKPIDAIGVGFVWNSKTNEPLHLGFGASAEFDVAGQKLDLGLLARMLNFNNAAPHVDTEFGQVLFSASFPVPTFFMSGATLTGSYTNQLALALAAKNKANVTKSLSIPPTTFIAWDSARIAAFLVRSWVAAKAADNPADKGFFYRLDKHLFPMLGDPAGPIQPLTPLDTTGQGPNFDNWKSSIFTTADGGTGALTFLWHLRALITGTETPDLLTGSSYFPLIVQGGAPPTFPPTTFPSTGSYPPVPDQAGVWIGIRPGPVANSGDLVIDFRRGNPPDVASFIIARYNNGSIERPAAPAGAQFTTMTAVLGALLPISYGSNSITGAATGDGGYEITVFTQTVNDPAVPPLNGTYKFGFVLHDNKPIEYKFDSPIFGMTLPPSNAANMAAELVTHLLQWLLNSVLSTPGHPLTASVNALIDIVKQAITTGGPPSVDNVITAVAGIAGNAAKFEIGDVFKLDIAPNGDLKPTIEIGPVAPEALKDAGISIGKIGFGAALALKTPGNPISSFTVSIVDLRLGQGGGPGATGLVSQLFPDLREVQGFTLNIDWKVGNALPAVTGGGKIPIQRTIGPLEIVALLVEFDTNSFTVGVDLYFALGPIQVVVYELGIVINYSGTVDLFLHGLGISFDGGGIKLAGLFLEIPQGPGKPSDYMGGAVVSVINLFQLSAIGGYTTDSSGDASLFIFASLVAPLGGPPWFFITGIAGGFGFNRKLPSPQLLGDHPFLKVMRGELPFDAKNPQASLVALGTAFAVEHGQYWIAAGLQFTCFGVINGKVIVAVSFGKHFSFNLLGMLSYGIQPIAYFELDFMMTADEEHFLLIAGMSPNSYLISPDIFSLQGQFCMGVWYAAPHAGDFVVSIGGYHPCYNKPDHYPDLARVGCKATVYDFIHVDVQCFFACTPQALMAGASVSLYAKFAGIAAGLDVYVDVLIQWDPFYLLARLGVTVWFEFMGRHEIGVDLQIHTPPFGGLATIHLFFVSFDISFGSDKDNTPHPRLYEFLGKQIGVPANPTSGGGASVPAFNTATDAGLIRIDVTDGRTTKPQADSKKQEGIDAAIPVNSEFRFTVKTKLPIGEPGKGATMATPSKLDGFTDMPLAELDDNHDLMHKPCVLTISGPNIDKAVQTRIIDFFPAATFGPVPLPEAQADGSARDAIGSIDTSKPAVPLSEGIEVNYAPTEDPKGIGYLKSGNEEFSEGENEYPLPLAWPKPNPQIFKVNKNATSFAAAAVKTKIKPAVPHPSSREVATAQNSKWVMPPLKVHFRAADVFRATVNVSPRSLTLAAAPAGAVAVDVPLSPVRRQELLPLSLRLAPVRAATPLRLLRIPAFTRAANPEFRVAPLAAGGPTVPPVKIPPVTVPPVAIPPVTVPPVVTHPGTIPPVTLPSGTVPPVVTQPGGPTAPKPPDLSILPRRAGQFELVDGNLSATHRLTTSGQGTLRAIFMGGGESILADAYVAAGQPVSTPPGTRRAVLLHAGTLPPVVNLPGLVPLIGIADNIGIEADTIAVTLSSRTFAAHGCALRSSTPLLFSPNLFDSVAGAQLLESMTQFTMFFPRLQAGATLILIVQPNAANPAPALDQIRWAALNAKLGGMSTVVGPDRTAFLMTVETTGPWQVVIDFGPDWRAAAVVASPTAVSKLMDRLRQSNDWDLIDGRIQTGGQDTPINVNLEVTQ